MKQMQITAIEWLTKTKAKVCLDEDTALILTSSDLRSYDLEVDSVISPEVYEELYKELDKRAKLKAMSLLQSKDYSEYELHAKLKKDFLLTALADSAVNYVKSYHYIDDRRLAENYVRYHSSGQSKLMIRQKLRLKGIDDSIINDVLEEFSFDEKAQIRALIAKKFGEYCQIPAEKRQKVMNFLLRKGYSYYDAASIIKEFDTNE